MKPPEEFLTRGKGNFINCTDYDDAIQAMKDYAKQMCEFQISQLRETAKNMSTQQFQHQDKQTVTDRPKVNMVVDYLEACCNELADCNNTEDEFQVFVKYEDLILSHLFPSQPSEKKPLEEITDEEEAERVYAIYRDEHPDTDLPNDYIFQWLLMKRFLQKGEIRNEND